MEKTSNKSIDEQLYIEEFYKLRKKYPDEIIKIDFFGGEPLLQLDKVQYIIDNIVDDNVKYFMPTNGLKMTPASKQMLLHNNVELSLSFDGLWQDVNRKQLTGKGTLSQYLDKKELFSGMRCHTMITAGNYDILDNHLFILNEFGMISEMTLVRDRNTWDIESVTKLCNGIDELFDWYIKNADEEMPFLILFYLRHFLLHKSKGVVIDTCGAGVDLFSFSENKITPCNRFKNDDDAINSIKEYTKMSVCNTCSVKNYCKKGCLYEQIKNEGPIADLCTIYRYMYKHVAQMTTTLIDHAKFNKLIMKELNEI
jgi:uncharacterized protein